MSRASSPLRERMIFAFGARRSGTFWLQRMIAAHPAVAAVPSETHLLSHGIEPLFERFQHAVRDSQQVGTVYVDRDLALDAGRDLCDVVFAQFLTPGAERLCERTPTHVYHLEFISAIYPDARFVHIVRDGRDVARSLVAQDFGPDKVGEAAREWGAAITAARAATLPPDRYLEVRYEELVDDPQRNLRELYRWLGLETDEKALAQGVAEAERRRNVGRSPSPGVGTEKWRHELTRGDLRAFNAVAGEQLAELGYEAARHHELPRSPLRRRASPTARTVVGRARHALARLRRDRSEPWGEGTSRQHRVDTLVGAIQSADASGLRASLTPNALVRVLGPDGSERHARGEPGVELLVDVAAADPAFSARQTGGDVFPSLPTFGLVLAYELPDGSVTQRLLFLELRGRRCNGVTLYQFPVAPPPGGGG